MKSIVFAFLGVVIFSLHNVIMEQKLSQFNTFALMAYFYASALPLIFLSIGFSYFNNQHVVAPHGSMILLAIFCGALYFVADIFYVGAFTSGGNLMTITIIVMMFPVVSSAMKYVWVRELPNSYQIAGYLLAMLSVFLVVKGSKI